MENRTTSPGKFALSYGVILGLILVVISVIMYVTGMQLEGVQWPIYVYYLLFLIMIFYAVSKYKKHNANFLSIKEAIKVGVIVGVISALVFGIYNIIFTYIIDPGYSDLVLESVREELEKNPQMTKEMIDSSMGWVETFSNPWMMTAYWLAMSAFLSLIYGVIAGAIMKNNRQ